MSFFVFIFLFFIWAGLVAENDFAADESGAECPDARFEGGVQIVTPAATGRNGFSNML
jgi:hypothetical protein